MYNVPVQYMNVHYMYDVHTCTGTTGSRYIHTCIHRYRVPVQVHVQVCRALSDFDGDFLPDLGTQHPPADYCARNSSLGPIFLKIGLKVAAESAASFEPMYV